MSLENYSSDEIIEIPDELNNTPISLEEEQLISIPEPLSDKTCDNTDYNIDTTAVDVDCGFSQSSANTQGCEALTEGCGMGGCSTTCESSCQNCEGASC